MKKLLAAVAALTIAASTAQAQVYNNGAPDGNGGNEMSQWIQAEDFTLALSTNVVGIRFWGLTTGGYAGSIHWRIYDNGTGAPGANILYSGSFNGAGTAQGGGCCGYTRYQFDMDTDFTLGAGTYWLGLHNGDYTNTNRDEFYWETTNGNATASGREDDAPFEGNWASNGEEHAFQLLGERNATVPEPTSLALVVVGFAGITAVARRRRA